MTDSYNQGDINLAAKSLGNSPLKFLVGPPGSGAPYASIQAAINAAGDRTIQNPADVLVLAGQYSENLIMRRGVFVCGFFGAQLLGTATFNLPSHTIPDQNVSSIQNIVFSPPAGLPGIIFSGVNFQIALAKNIQIDSDGASSVLVTNTGTDAGNLSAILLNNSNISSSGSPTVSQSAGISFLFATTIDRESDADRAIEISGGALFLSDSSVSGDIDIDIAAAFAFAAYSRINSDVQPAISCDAIVLLDQCSIQTNSSPAISGSGIIVYSDLAYLGGGRGIDPGVLFSFDTGQAYQPSLPGAAAAWAAPAPETLNEAIDRIVIALSTSVAPGAGIAPF